MRKLRIVQIGMGHDHANYIAEAKMRTDLFEVVGVAVPESDREYLERYNIYNNVMGLCEGVPQYSVEELLELPDIDAVFIETEELNLVKYAQMAADKGYHIHMDKPGNANHEEFVRLVETMRKNGKVFHMGYMYRYNPAVMKTMERIKKGELGQIYSVEAHMDCYHSPTKRRWLGQFPGGMMFFLGCHLVDLIYQIKGEPEEILPLSCPTGIDGVDDASDYGFALFKYKDGVSFAKTCACEPGGFMRRQLIVCGSKETVRIQPWEAYAEEGKQFTEWREVNGASWGTNGTYYKTEPFRRYDYLFEAFHKMVLGEMENPYTYDYEIALHKTVLRACGVKN